MIELLIVLVLIAINGFFALSEMSVVTSRKPRLKQRAVDSARARKALALAENPERLRTRKLRRTLGEVPFR